MVGRLLIESSRTLLGKLNVTEKYKRSDIKAIADEIISAADSRRSTENSQWSTYVWRLEEEARQAQSGK